MPLDVMEFVRGSGEAENPELKQAVQHRMRANTVMDVIGRYFGVSQLELKSDRRGTQTVNARYWASYLMRHTLGVSVSTASNVMGLDTETIRYGAGVIRSRIESNAHDRMILAELKRKLASAGVAA